MNKYNKELETAWSAAESAAWSAAWSAAELDYQINKVLEVLDDC